MRLYFEDPRGGRLAIDTEQKAYFADFMTPDTIIDDNHRFIKVADSNSIYAVASEAEFNGYEYRDFLNR